LLAGSAPFSPRWLEDLRREEVPLKPLNLKEPEAPRFKFGHQALDNARARHQMVHEAYEIASNDNLWLAEAAVRFPRCGKVTIGADPSECSGCGMHIPRRNPAPSKPSTSAPKNAKRLLFFGTLGIAATIAVALYATHFLIKNNRANTLLGTASQHHEDTKLPGEWRTIRSALRLLHHFHGATSVEEKASLVKEFPNRTATLSSYYEKHDFEPSRIDQIVKTGWHEVEGAVSYLIHGIYADGNAFLAFVCEEDSQLALDWQAFTGHNAVPFTHFLDQEINDPTEMRVVAQSISVDTFPELAAEYRFYQLHDRDRSNTCWALVKKHSVAGRTLASLIAPPKDPAFSLLSTTSDISTESHPTPPRRLILTLKHDDVLGIIIDEVVSTEWLSQPVPADVHFDI